MSAGHIRPRGPGAWELKYDLGRDPKTGRRITRYKTVRGKKADAQRELRNLLGAVDKGVVRRCRQDDGRRLAEAVDRGSAAHRFAQDARALREIVDKHLVPALGAIQLAKLAPVHIQGFYSDALKSGRLDGKGGLSPQTVRAL